MNPPAEAKKVLYCAVHGPIEADRALSSRGHRLRCPEEGCGRWLAARPTDGKQGGGGSPSLPVDVATDPEIIGLVKEREKAKLGGEILEIRGYMKRVGALEKQMATLNKQIEGLQSELHDIPTANLKAEFACENCGATELVEVNIRCAKCDAETWWGWSPE